MTTYTWYLDVDWNADGTYEANESGYLKMVTTDRGAPRPFSETGLTKHRVGRAVVKLDNYDKRFDAWYTSSPIYPNVRQRVPARLRVNDGSTTYTVFTGEIADIRTDPVKKEVTLTIEDGWRWLKNNDAQVEPKQNKTVAQAIDLVLDAVNWNGGPAAWGRSLDADTDELQWWWAAGKAADVIHDLVNVEFGAVWVDVDGDFRLEGRRQLRDKAADVSLDETKLRQRIDLGQPEDNLYNIIRVSSKLISRATSAVVWSLQEATQGRGVYFATNETKYFTARFSSPVDALVTPVSGTDWTGTFTAEGDDTSNFAVTVTSSGAKSADITVAHSASAKGGYLTLLQLRGREISQPAEVQGVDKDSTSRGDFGDREMEIETEWGVWDALTARNYAEWVLLRLKDPSPTPVIRLIDQPVRQFNRDLYDKVDLDLSNIWLTLQDDFLIGRIRHRWQVETGQACETEYTLFPTDGTNYWVLGDATLGKLGQTTYLTF